jgi:RNA polymerase sigma factor (TIGR02999 family)
VSDESSCENQDRDRTLSGEEETGGDARPLDDALTRTMYEQIKPVAAALLRASPGHTLQPTAVVNEAYLKLARSEGIEVRDRAHMIALAAKAMRHLVADHARKKLSDKRGGGWARVTLDGIGSDPGRSAYDAGDVHEALAKLESISARQGRVVELRFFGGLTESEIAGVLGVSERTVRAEWRFARAWLRNELGGDGP